MRDDMDDSLFGAHDDRAPLEPRISRTNGFHELPRPLGLM
jgi:hypothetical protein